MQKDNGKFKIILLGILFFGLFVWAQSSRAEIISADRRVTWQGNVGVSGDIPTRSTICSTAACVTAATPISGDNKPNIQSAITSCPAGQVVLLGAGTYTIDSRVMLKADVVLRGRGPGNTIIATSNSYSLVYMSGAITVDGDGGSWDMSYPAGINLSSGYTKGSTVISTSSAHGWNVGDVILIDQLNSDSSDPPVTLTDSEGCNANCGRTSGGVAVRSLGQVNKVKAVLSTSQVQLEVPLYQTYSAALTPQGVTVLGLFSNVGIEDLTIDTSNINSTDSTAFSLNGAESSWVSNVEVVSGAKWMATALLYHTYRNTIRQCQFHGSPGVVYAGSSYGLTLLAINSANLIENNIFYDLGTPIIMDGVASGNVFAYNYILAQPVSSSDGYYQHGAIAFHGAHPNMNLFEGNIWRGLMFADFYHGSSAYNTFFRNKGYLEANPSGRRDWLFDLFKKAHYYNAVGNVLGTTGEETVYEATGTTVDYGTWLIYRLGYQDASGGWQTTATPSPYGPADTDTKATLYRHGNWDSVTNGVVWDPNISDHTIPNSLYLTSKPSFFGNLSWPAVGPDLNPMTGTIPAKARYEGQSYPYGSGDTTPPAAPTGLRVN